MTAALEGWWVVSSTPRPHFTPGKDPAPIVQEAGWAPGSVWTGGKSRSHRDSIPDRPARSLVAIPTEIPGPLVADNRPGKLKDGYGLHVRLSSVTSNRTRKMNNKISRTRNKQSIGRARFIKSVANDYRLWYASTFNKWIMDFDHQQMNNGW